MLLTCSTSRIGTRTNVKDPFRTPTEKCLRGVPRPFSPVWKTFARRWLFTASATRKISCPMSRKWTRVGWVSKGCPGATARRAKQCESSLWVQFWVPQLFALADGAHWQCRYLVQRVGVLGLLCAALAFPFRSLLSRIPRRHAHPGARRNAARHFVFGRMHVAALRGARRKSIPERPLFLLVPAAQTRVKPTAQPRIERATRRPRDSRTCNQRPLGRCHACAFTRGKTMETPQM